jgi:hypothetical protein
MIKMENATKTPSYYLVIALLLLAANALVAQVNPKPQYFPYF